MSRTPVMSAQRAVWSVALVGLVASLLPISGVGAAEGNSVAADDSAVEAQAQAESMPEDSVGDVEVVRYAGSDPYELSIEVAQALVDAEGGTSEWVALASGESWADAAAAGPLAASLGAPLVLVPPGGLQTFTARPDFVEFLRSTGIRRVVIVGNSDVLPNHEPSVLFGLGMLPRNIQRIHGGDPVGTSVAVASRIGAPADLADLGRTVIIASDQSVADAVAVGPLAAAGPFPLLLTAPDALDPSIATFLTEQEIAHVVLAGGTGAIAPAVQEAIETTGATVTRLAGRNRSATARLAAELFEQHTADDPACADSPIRIGLVPDQYPEQALTAGPLLAQACTALRYAESGRLPADLHNALYLLAPRSPDLQLVIFGDRAVIPDTTVNLSLPPLRLAYVHVAPNEAGRGLRAQISVINEQGVIQHFPRTATSILSWEVSGLTDGRSYPQLFCWLAGLDWSPDGRFLTYGRDCGSGAFVLDTLSGESYRIEHDEYELMSVIDLTWSPDSTQLVFASVIDDPATEGRTFDSDLTHFSELFVHDVASRSTKRLTYNTDHDLVGRWSPDSRIVSTASHRQQNPGSPHYRVPQSLELIEVATGRSALNSSSHTIFARPWAIVWSPDGTHIGVRSGLLPDGEFGWWTDQAYLVKADGTDQRRLTPHECDECPYYNQHPGGGIIAWDSTSSKLAFRFSEFEEKGSGMLGPPETIRYYSLDLTSGMISTIRTTTIDGYEPWFNFFGWSQDGKSLLFLESTSQASKPLLLKRMIEDSGQVELVREIPPIWLNETQPVRGMPHLSQDQSQMVIVYQGRHEEDLGMWLADVEPSMLRPLIDYGDIVSHNERGAFVDFPDPLADRTWNWSCAADWSDIGILSTCEYRHRWAF